MRPGQITLGITLLVCAAAAPPVDRPPPENTGRQLDLAIDGDGFFVLRDGDHLVYTRNGNFFVNSNGILVSAAGMPLDPPIVFPRGSTEIAILPNGSIHVLTPGENQKRALRPLQLTTFSHPAALKRKGDVLFSTPAAGEPTIRTPGQAPAGRLLQGFLEPASK